MEAGTATGTLTPDVSKILGSPELANQLDTKEGLAPLPAAPTTTAVAAVAQTGEAPKELDCRTMLAPEQLSQVEAYAKGIYPKLAADPNQLDDFGADAV